MGETLTVTALNVAKIKKRKEEILSIQVCAALSLLHGKRAPTSTAILARTNNIISKHKANGKRCEHTHSSFRFT